MGCCVWGCEVRGVVWGCEVWGVAYVETEWKPVKGLALVVGYTLLRWMMSQVYKSTHRWVLDLESVLQEIVELLNLFR